MYLGYTFNERATNTAHIREIVRKVNKVVGCVWGDDFKRRMMMFESIIESILMYGTEIWGCGTRGGRERQEKYLRWVLGVNRETSRSEGRVQK
jgi:hypothetical protein